MAIRPRWFLSLVLGLSAASVHADVTVRFDHPENFKDFTLNSGPPDKVQATLMADLTKHLQTLANDYLPEGYNLQIDFKDIDMAGGFEGWRIPDMMWTRIISDVYPPKFTLHYVLQDSKGQVVAERDQVVSDLNYRAMVNVKQYSTQDSLRYEKALLQRWFEGTFGR